MTEKTNTPSSKKGVDKKDTFAFTHDNQLIVEDILKKYPTGRQASAILPLFDLAQRQSGGWLPQSAIEAIAALLKMPVIRAFEVATFYTMFNLKPVGKHHIQLCRTLPCWLRGGDEIRAVCESHLGVKRDEVTPDGKFSFTEVECLGACINAPMIQINDDYYENLTPETLQQILQSLAAGKSVELKSAQSEKGSSLKSKKVQPDVEKGTP